MQDLFSLKLQVRNLINNNVSWLFAKYLLVTQKGHFPHIF